MHVNPIRQNQRIIIIDILRGWALLGVVVMNYVDYYYLGLPDKAKMDALGNVLQVIGRIIFASKSWTMLSFLFGYGFAVLMENTAAKGVNPVGFFTRRMFWLFIIAVVNSSFFFGDILKDYAVMGMILLVFKKISGRTAFWISIGLLVAMPAVSAYVNGLHAPGGFKLMEPHFPYYRTANLFDALWFGLVGTYAFEILSPGYLITVHIIMLACFFMGLAVQKTGFFVNLDENKDKVKWICLGGPLFMILLGLFTWLLKTVGWMRFYQPGFLFILASMAFLMTGITWLYSTGKLTAFFKAMQTIGKMTLTNYLVQNFLGIFLFSGFGLGFSLIHKIHFGYYMLFALVIYVVQVYFSKWWLSKYYYGPVEWLWRQLSYGKRLKMRKGG